MDFSRWWLLVLVGACLSGLGSTLAADGPFRAADYKAAKQLAQHEHKLLLIDFYTTWCPPCQQLDRVTWADPHVAVWLRAHTVAIKLNAERDTQLAMRYRVTAYPTLVFLKPDGSEADRLVGFRDPQTFLKEATSILAGQDTISRLRTQLGRGHDFDPMLLMRLGDAYLERGRDAEALAAYARCFDHGLDVKPAFAGVRLSFLLARWTYLGRTYAPARSALRQRRDAAEHPLTTGQGTMRQVEDVAALDRAMGDTQHTLALYDSMTSHAQAHLRQALFGEVLGQLIEERRYQDGLDGAGNIDARLDEREQSFYAIKRELNARGKADPQLLQMLRQQSMIEGGMYYEALLANKQSEKAQALADRLVHFDNSAETWSLLMIHAMRAGDSATAHRLADTGWQSVPDDQKGIMVDSIQQVFKDEPEPDPHASRVLTLSDTGASLIPRVPVSPSPYTRSCDP